MIVKKIKNPRKSAGKRTRVARLTAYIRAAGGRGGEEKCIYAGARGFLTDEPRSQAAEMFALAQESVRSKDPINHYVLSWREGEQPSAKQVEEAVGIFMRELGVQDHQAVYGLHADTDNQHLHIALNRVHPETGKCVEINKGFDIEAAHRAVALIERAHGWQREERGRYAVLETGEVEPRRAPREPRAKQPDQPKRDREQRTGERSAERIAIEDGAPIIKRAQSWEQLHRELGEVGLRYERTGSGAVIHVGAVAVKASSADRAASLSKLEKRLGPYEASSQAFAVAPRAAEPLRAVPGWSDYAREKRERADAKRAAQLEQHKRHEQERKELADQQRAQREQQLGRNWRGKGAALNALRSVMAAQQAAEKAAQRDRQREERERLRERYRPQPSLEQWQRQQGREQLEHAERWRTPRRLEGDRYDAPTPRDIRAYQAEIVGREVHYRKAGAGGASFIDEGKRIDLVNQPHEDPDAELAALQLAAQKWGRFAVEGDDAYKARCVALSAEHGFKLANPELQDALARERARLQAERKAQAMPQPKEQHSTPATQPREEPSEASALSAYDVHHRDVMKRQTGDVDLSRVDSMIAVRMRVTGHDQAAIESAIRQGAPAARQKAGRDEGARDWNDYARRTARFAFSPAGERQATDLGKRYGQHWARLEGRELESEDLVREPKTKREQFAEQLKGREKDKDRER